MTTKLTWQTVALIAVLGTVATGLGFTDWGSGEILGLIGILAGVGGGAAVAGNVSGRVDHLSEQTSALSEQTSAQDTQLAKIHSRVNGELDERMAAAVARGTDDILRVLRDQGVIR
jgi:hypothetical protein